MEGFEIVVFIVWLFPFFILCSMLYGYMRAQLQFRETNSIKKIIIQITTIGNHDVVNRNVHTIRSYNLTMPYEIWIVTEPNSFPERYKGADRIIVVPPDFRSIAKYKARALYYSCLHRRNLGIDSPEVKILFLDDDTLPAKKYLEKCFIGDYDVMEGIIQPRLNYGTRYSYVENMRTLACMSVCSVYQSQGHPVWVHGEGICVKASAEQVVGWNFDVIASEDLVFGHTCATKKMKWGFAWNPIYITSPWTFQDFFRQRKRWLWGNIHAISHILTWQSKIRIILFYIVGTFTLLISISGTILDLTGMLDFSLFERIFLYGSLATWLGIYGYIGHSVGNKRIKHVFLSMALVWYTSIMNTFPIWTGLFLAKPKKFEVVTKEKIEEPKEAGQEEEQGQKRKALKGIELHLLNSKLKKNIYELAIGVSTTIVCFLASLLLLSRDSNSLVYYADAVAHLVISRSIFDSLNPGFLQLGSAYMPLSHILLMPFVINDFLFHTGLAGTIVSSISTAITAVMLYRIAKTQFGNSKEAGLLASSLFVLNPSVIYMGIIPMMEAPFMMFFVVSVYYFRQWYNNYSFMKNNNTHGYSKPFSYFYSPNSKAYLTLIKCALSISAASLTRYEGWYLPIAVIVSLLIAIYFHDMKKSWKHSIIYTVPIVTIFSFLGIGLWLLYNLIYFKNPLYFLSNPYTPRPFGEYLRGNILLSLSIIADVVRHMYGLSVVIISILGLLSYVWLNLRSIRLLVIYLITVGMLSIPAIFDISAMIAGFGEIYPAKTGGWYTSRILVLMAPLLAFCSTSFAMVVSNKVVVKKIERQEMTRNGNNSSKYSYTHLTIYAIIIIVIVGSYGYNFAIQPLEVAKTTVLSDSYSLLPFLDRYKYSFETGETLGKLLHSEKNGSGKNIVLLTPILGRQQIMLASGIPLKNFIHSGSGQSWLSAGISPWIYGDYLVIRRPVDVHPDPAPVNDPIEYWRSNKQLLFKHYEIIYENPYYEMLKRK